MDERAAWDRFYDEDRYVMMWPSDSVVRFVRRFRFAYGEGESALDLGCGNGRHLFLLAREAFRPVGVDLSARAVARANEWMSQEGFDSCAEVSDGGALRFPDAHFGIAVSDGVLDSMLPDVAKLLVAEVLRCLRPGGEFFATLRASADRDFMQIGRVVAPNTVEVEDDCERGTVQHFFDASEVEELISGFECLSLARQDRVDWRGSGRMFSRWEVHARKREGVTR